MNNSTKGLITFIVLLLTLSVLTGNSDLTILFFKLIAVASIITVLLSLLSFSSTTTTSLPTTKVTQCDLDIEQEAIDQEVAQAKKSLEQPHEPNTYDFSDDPLFKD